MPRSRVVASLLQPIDAAWLAALRILLGTLLGISMLRFIAYGWIDRFFVQPRFRKQVTEVLRTADCRISAFRFESQGVTSWRTKLT